MDIKELERKVDAVLGVRLEVNPPHFKTVFNARGTTDFGCFCDSWLEHWHKFADDHLLHCAAADCRNIPDVGAHVRVEGKNGVWIIPLCYQCNKRKGLFKVRRNLATASPQFTCGLSRIISNRTRSLKIDTP